MSKDQQCYNEKPSTYRFLSEDEDIGKFSYLHQCMFKFKFHETTATCSSINSDEANGCLYDIVDAAGWTEQFFCS